MTIDELIKDLIDAKEHGLEGKTIIKVQVGTNIGSNDVELNGKIEYTEFDQTYFYINTVVV